MTIGVYKIVNKRNGKYYVGSSVEIEKRFWRHKKELINGKHHCDYLQRAWNKYGEENFSFEIVHECATEEEARELEQHYLDTEYSVLYNTSKLSSGGDLISYHPLRDEIVAKMTKSVKERYASMTDEERKEKYGTYGMQGKRHTLASRKKMSESSKGNQNAKGAKRSLEQRAKLSKIASERVGERNPFYGRHHSEESKKLIAEKNKGKLPPNTKRVEIDGKTYASATKAAKELGIATATVTNRIRSDKFPTYKFLET